MENQIKVIKSSSKEVRELEINKEGLNEINVTGLELSGKDAKNYTLLGETHEFLFELKAKFKH